MADLAGSVLDRFVWLASLVALQACGSGGGGDPRRVTVSFAHATSTTTHEGHSGSRTYSVPLVLSTGGVAALPEDIDITLVVDAASTATEGLDYMLSTPEVSFPSGTRPGSIIGASVTILGDSLFEGVNPSESFVLRLTSIGPSDGEAGDVDYRIGSLAAIHATIPEDDVLVEVSFATPSSAAVPEGDSGSSFPLPVELVLSLTNAAQLPAAVSVTIAIEPAGSTATEGLDFQPPSAITFPVGAVDGATAPAIVPILGDDWFEGGTPPESFVLEIAAVAPLTGTGGMECRIGTGATHEIMLGDDDPTTARVSLNSSGIQANDRSFSPVLSADGRFVAFQSDASNLVPGDNGLSDVFVHDRGTGETTRVSTTPDGTEPDESSNVASISADGRFVAYFSRATNLVPGDTNAVFDSFVWDRTTGQTTRVSVASDGSQGNGFSTHPSLSADGRYAAFLSDASNLVPGDTNAKADVFVHDRVTGQTTRVSVASDGSQANGFSGGQALFADGRFVAFASDASNLVPGDTNAAFDVFVHDRETGQTRRVSVASDGSQANGHSSYVSISADGRCVAFWSLATNLVPGDSNATSDVFVHDRVTGQTSLVSVTTDGSQANEDSGNPSLSADGRFVAFDSYAGNLVPPDRNSETDIFVHDRATGRTARVSVAADGSQADSACSLPDISADGRHVAFESVASNLVPGDTNSENDVFVHTLVDELSMTASGAASRKPTLTTGRLERGRPAWAEVAGVEPGDVVTLFGGTSGVPALERLGRNGPDLDLLPPLQVLGTAIGNGDGSACIEFTPSEGSPPVVYLQAQVLGESHGPRRSDLLTCVVLP